MEIQIIAGTARRGLLAAALLLPAILSAQTYSTPVRDVENPARNAWQGGCAIAWQVGEFNFKECSISLPANKAFMLVTASFYCFAANLTDKYAYAQVSAGNIGNRHYLTMQPQDTGNSSIAFHSGLFLFSPATQPTPAVTFSVSKLLGGAVGNCAFRATGYTLP